MTLFVLYLYSLLRLKDYFCKKNDPPYRQYEEPLLETQVDYSRASLPDVLLRASAVTSPEMKVPRVFGVTISITTTNSWCKHFLHWTATLFAKCRILHENYLFYKISNMLRLSVLRLTLSLDYRQVGKILSKWHEKTRLVRPGKKLMNIQTAKGLSNRQNFHLLGIFS